MSWIRAEIAKSLQGEDDDHKHGGMEVWIYLAWGKVSEPGNLIRGILENVAKNGRIETRVYGDGS